MPPCLQHEETVGNESDGSTVAMNLQSARGGAESATAPWGMARPGSRAVAAVPQPRRAPPTALILSLDAVATLLALHFAVWLRFDGMVPAPYLAALPAVLPLLAGARIVSNMAVGIHRWSFRLAGLPDALRVVTAGLVGTLAFTVLCTQVVPGGMPRSVYVLEFFLATASFGALRFAPRAGLRWLGKRARTKAGAARTIIVGSGDAAELLARDLQRSSDSPYAIVGFAS